MSPSSLQEEIGKKNPFDLPEEEAYLNLMRTSSILAAEFGALFRSKGLSESSYNVLRILRGAGETGKPSQQIARDMVVQLPDITRLVDRLETKGLVARARSTTDRRVVQVRITEQGIGLLEELDNPVRALHRKQLGHMGADRLAALSDLLSEARQPAEDLQVRG
ncbi:MAG: MarR family transcriptional regulator [Planctomycetota bacterium]